MNESVKLLFLAAAYAVFWMGTFGYVFFVQRRLRALEIELVELQMLLESSERPATDQD